MFYNSLSVAINNLDLLFRGPQKINKSLHRFPSHGGFPIGKISQPSPTKQTQDHQRVKSSTNRFSASRDSWASPVCCSLAAWSFSVSSSSCCRSWRHLDQRRKNMQNNREQPSRNMQSNEKRVQQQWEKKESETIWELNHSTCNMLSVEDRIGVWACQQVSCIQHNGIFYEVYA